jgi:hypothetical protein
MRVDRHYGDATLTIFPVLGLRTTTEGFLVDPGGHTGGSGGDFDGSALNLLIPAKRLSE